MISRKDHLKILERSPNRLRLVHSEWYIGSLMAGAGVVVMSAGILLLGGVDTGLAAIMLLLAGGLCGVMGLIQIQRLSVTLDRRIGIVHVQQAGALGTSVRAAPLAQLRTAQKAASDSGKPQLVLQFHDREYWAVSQLPLPEQVISERCELINQWLQAGVHFSNSHGCQPSVAP